MAGWAGWAGGWTGLGWAGLAKRPSTSVRTISIYPGLEGLGFRDYCLGFRV